MSSLIRQIQDLRTALKNNVSAEQSRTITENCQQILNRLEPSSTLLLLGLQVRQVLSEGSEDPTTGCPPSASLKQTAVQAQKALGAFRQAWIEKGDKARHAKALDPAADTAAALAKRLTEDVRSAWVARVEELRQRFHIDAPVLQAQKSVPGDEKICLHYETTLATFNQEVATLPAKAQHLETIRSLAETLAEFRDQMNFNLPEDVKVFFRCLDAQPLGIPLGQVPRSVLDWLAEKHLLNSFRIRRHQG